MDYLTVGKSSVDELWEPWEKCGGVETKQGRVIRERWSKDVKWRLSSVVLLPWAVRNSGESGAGSTFINSLGHLHAAHIKRCIYTRTFTHAHTSPPPLITAGSLLPQYIYL